MKNLKSVIETTSFQYLSDDDITHPHYHIAVFYGCHHNIEVFRLEMLNLLKTACSISFYGDQKRFYSSHQQFIRLIELAFVLRESTENFILNETHPLYRKNKGPFVWHEENIKESRSFIYQTDEFYDVLDFAEKETAHWPQENGIGGESHWFIS